MKYETYISIPSYHFQGDEGGKQLPKHNTNPDEELSIYEVEGKEVFGDSGGPCITFFIHDYKKKQVKGFHRLSDILNVSYGDQFLEEIEQVYDKFKDNRHLRFYIIGGYEIDDEQKKKIVQTIDFLKRERNLEEGFVCVGDEIPSTTIGEKPWICIGWDILFDVGEGILYRAPLSSKELVEVNRNHR